MVFLPLLCSILSVVDVSLSFVFSLKSKSQGEIPTQQYGCNCCFNISEHALSHHLKGLFETSPLALCCEENTATRLQALHVEY